MANASWLQPLIYLGLLLAILVVPKALQRFLVPAPITCLVFGVFAALYSSVFGENGTLALLSVLGISSLFLFAGLEVSIPDLVAQKKPILAHLLIRLAALGLCAWAAMAWLALSWQAAGILALALLTPSTGFILDSLERLGLQPDERQWVVLKAISGELLALLLMFVILQSGSLGQLALSSGILVAMVLLLPLLFALFARLILPYAPGSEFSFLVLLAIVAASITKQLGVYYLVGAFLVGLLARRIQERMPAIASHDTMHAVKLFASFFVPFYFFHGGVHVPAQALGWPALWLGLALTSVILPLRIAVQWLQRRLMFKESARSSLTVSITLAPTLIFTLVLASILRERYAIPDALYGALLFYALASTLLPSLVLRKPLELDLAAGHVHADTVEVAGGSRAS